jgi:hypothetical protein
MLVDEENFVDVKFLKSQSLTEATGRFKVCQKLVEYLKNLEYLYDLSFNSFLYPNIKDTRRLLGFLFEFLFKGEDRTVGQAKVEQERPTNEQKVLQLRKLQTWTKRPWMLPDFFKDTKRNMLIGGEIISVPKDIDAERIAASKSKKIKSVYAMMTNELRIPKLVADFKSGSTVLGRGIQ